MILPHTPMLRVMRKLLPLVILLGASCNTYKTDDGQSGSNNPTDAVYQPPPPRQVYGDGAIGVPGSGGTGGSSGTGGANGTGGAPANPDASIPKDAPVTPPGNPDAAAPSGPDAAEFLSDVSSGGCLPCDLVAQDCAKSQGCYPAGAGRGCCQSSEAPAGPGGPCFQASQCQPGSVCVGSPDATMCLAICSTSVPPVPGPPAC